VLGWVVLGTALFALGLTIFPLYHGDQLVYFLAGLAQAGYGNLDQDWAANAAILYPVFTLLVRYTHLLLGAGWNYVYLLVFMGVYVWFLAAIPSRLFGVARLGTVFLAACAVLILLHTHAFDRALAATGWLRGIDFWNGVAGQYLIHPEFVPSTFGVLLLPAIYLFLRGNGRWAAATVAAAATFHPAVTLVGGALVASFMLVLYRRGERREALAVGGVALLLVLPAVIWSALLMQPTDPALYQQAREIFRFVRTPDSQNPAQWLELSTLVKLALVAAALWLVARTELFVVMLVPFLIGTVLTVVQIATDSADLALLVPWRVMALLVPLSAAIVIFRGAQYALQRWPRPAMGSLAVILPLLGLAVYLGATETITRFESGPSNNPLQEMFAYVSEHKQRGDIYLLPVRREFGRLEHFRLATGAAQFVDFKAFPTRDVDIVEWETRMKLAELFYGANKRDGPRALAYLVARYGVTHVLFDRDHPMEPAGILEPLHRNKKLILFKVNDRFREQAREVLRRSLPAPRAPAASGQVLPG